ncbi:MAG TPA: branched-chain amino acid ABC transporter permease [Candidatus Limnocylindria bacterium]
MDRVILRRALTGGVVAGVSMLYLAAVGLVESFTDREIITGFLTLGRLILLAPPLIVGYWLAGRLEGSARQVAAGAVAGLVGGLFLGAGLLLGFALSPGIREVLVRISPDLLSFIAWGLDPVPGALVNVVIATGLGLIGAGGRALPGRFRRPLVAGSLAIVFMAMIEPFLRPRLLDFDLIVIANWIYSDHGLTPIAAVVVFLVGAGLAVIGPPARATMRARLETADPGPRRLFWWIVALAAIGFLYTLPVIAGSFLSQVLVLVGLYVLLGLGLNIVVGFAGLLDLGYVAFYAVGAYFTALLTSPTSSLGLGLNFWVALPIVVVGAATVGLLIGAPVLRLRGDYLAIVTLGFGEIARLLFLSEALEPWFGGVQGILGIPPMIGTTGSYTLPIIGEVSGPAATYYPLVGFCALAAYFTWRLKFSRTGRAWNSMREDEDVAQATGVNIVNYKLLAFALGASVGCLGGAVYVTHLESVFPGAFNIFVSITALAVVIVGGMGSIPGVILGALALVGLPELLREFAEFRLLVYGGVIVAMMLLRPEGFWPDKARRRELHEGEGEDDANPENVEAAAGAAPSQA